jgi:hypothetical protein
MHADRDVRFCRLNKTTAERTRKCVLNFGHTEFFFESYNFGIMKLITWKLIRIDISRNKFGVDINESS